LKRNDFNTNYTSIQNITQGVGIGRILCNDLGNGKWISNLELECSESLYMAGSLKTAASQMIKYNLDPGAAQEVRWNMSY